MNVRTKLYKQFMHGFTYIIPLVVIGGVFLTLYDRFDQNVFFNVGSTALFLVYPIISAFIAYAISDKPGFIVGLLGGALLTSSDSGFLGVVFMGFMSGYIILLLHFLFKKFPIAIKGLIPVFLYPVIGSMFVIFVYLGIDALFPFFNGFIRDVFAFTGDIGVVLLLMILSTMMVYDLGGPVNKVAYIVGISTILNGTSTMYMAQVMIAGMIPPLSIFIASIFHKRAFEEENRSLARKNIWMGLAFISEGAIAFVKKDKELVLAFIFGGLLSSVFVFIFQVESRIAHGGLLSVFFINGWIEFVVILLVSSLVSAWFVLLILKMKKNVKISS
jgi:PTS system fructose-specific IIC component